MFICFEKCCLLHDKGSFEVMMLTAAASNALPISLEMMALKRLPQEAFGIMTSMEPAVAALQWLAIVCVMLAAGGSALTARRLVAQSPAAEVLM